MLAFLSLIVGPQEDQDGPTVGDKNEVVPISLSLHGLFTEV